MVYDKKKRAVPVVIVAGMGSKTRAIGRGNELLWHVPEDLQRFKELTLGHPVIMGRKTFESIVALIKKPLPGRKNIVVTRDPSYRFEGVDVAHSLEDAFEKALEMHPTEIHIGGGAALYHEALPFVDRLYLTHFDDDAEGDVHFPSFEDEFEIINIHESRTYHDLAYRWIDYKRR